MCNKIVKHTTQLLSAPCLLPTPPRPPPWPQLGDVAAAALVDSMPALRQLSLKGNALMDNCAVDLTTDDERVEDRDGRYSALLARLERWAAAGASRCRQRPRCRCSRSDPCGRSY